MLAKKFRFHNFSFDKFLKVATKRENECFKIWVALNNLNHSRFAITTPKSIFKGAVERNKIRRKIYNLIRLNLVQFKKGDYLIRPKQAVVSKTYPELTAKILEPLSR